MNYHLNFHLLLLEIIKKVMKISYHFIIIIIDNNCNRTITHRILQKTYIDTHQKFDKNNGRNVSLFETLFSFVHCLALTCPSSLYLLVLSKLHNFNKAKKLFLYKKKYNRFFIISFVKIIGILFILVYLCNLTLCSISILAVVGLTHL